MSALIYCLSSKAHQFSVLLLMVFLLPLSSVQAAQIPAVAPAKVNSSHIPHVLEAQKEAAQERIKQEKAEQEKAAVQEVTAAVEPESTGESAEDGTTQEQAAQPALPESQSSSAKYLRTFDASRKRCPFSKMVDGNAPVADTTWYTDTGEATEDDASKSEEFRFDGRNKPNLASYARLPNIKVTGLMQVGGRRAVSANIQNKGVCILYENDNVVIEANAKTNLSKSLTIKKIHLNGMTVILDDGNEITGKFY